MRFFEAGYLSIADIYLDSFHEVEIVGFTNADNQDDVSERKKS